MYGKETKLSLPTEQIHGRRENRDFPLSFNIGLGLYKDRSESTELSALRVGISSIRNINMHRLNVNMFRPKHYI